MSKPPRVAYLIMDVESVADGQIVADVRYPGEARSLLKTPSPVIAKSYSNQPATILYPTRIRFQSRWLLQKFRLVSS